MIISPFIFIYPLPKTTKSNLFALPTKSQYSAVKNTNIWLWCFTALSAATSRLTTCADVGFCNLSHPLAYILSHVCKNIIKRESFVLRAIMWRDQAVKQRASEHLLANRCLSWPQTLSAAEKTNKRPVKTRRHVCINTAGGSRCLKRLSFWNKKYLTANAAMLQLSLANLTEPRHATYFQQFAPIRTMSVKKNNPIQWYNLLLIPSTGVEQAIAYVL